MIIEDEPLISALIQELLADEGATSFDFAMSESDAVAAARARRPQLITSDVKLLEGTGPQAVSAIRADLGPIPVIFITSTPEARDPNGTSAIVLTKPVTCGQLSYAFRDLAPLSEAEPRPMSITAESVPAAPKSSPPAGVGSTADGQERQCGSSHSLTSGQQR